MTRISFVSWLLLSILSPLCLAQGRVYQVTSGSKVEIHLDTSGFLGFLGDKHLIEAPIQQGRIRYISNDPGKNSVELEFSSASLRVRDPGLEEKKRLEVQQTMEGPQVLDVKNHPRILFKSSSVKQGKGAMEITGDLTLRGNTRKVTVLAKVNPSGPRLQATGSSRFRQTEFGIKPVTAGGGTVRVKDEVKLTFQISADAVKE
ncbi:MAG TPA: YceI family protein [Acidobacteriota bacterium]|jgi:polyisoprenoid-binding protein YceI